VIFRTGDPDEGRDLAPRNAVVVLSAHGSGFDGVPAVAKGVRRSPPTAGLPWGDLTSRATGRVESLAPPFTVKAELAGPLRGNVRGRARDA
jgi:hypothetical protein